MRYIFGNSFELRDSLLVSNVAMQPDAPSGPAAFTIRSANPRVPKDLFERKITQERNEYADFIEKNRIRHWSQETAARLKTEGLDVRYLAIFPDDHIAITAIAAEARRCAARSAACPRSSGTATDS